MKDADDNETSQAVEAGATLFVTPTGFVTTSFGGETALSLTRQMAEAVHTPELALARRRCAHASAGCSASRSRGGGPLAGACSLRSGSRDIGRSSSSSRASRRFASPGWLLTPDNAGPFHADRALRRRGGGVELDRRGRVCRTAVRQGRLPRRGHRRARTRRLRASPIRSGGGSISPERITDEAYLTWFTLMLGRPLLGGQVHDTLRALDYLRSRPDVGGPVSLVGDGPHGVIALYAAALDARHRAASRCARTITDYGSLAVAERYTQPFGIYAYGILREFDLPDVARAAAPRPVLLLDPVAPRGEPAGPAASDQYKGVPNATVRTLSASDDPIEVLATWALPAASGRRRP